MLFLLDDAFDLLARELEFGTGIHIDAELPYRGLPPGEARFISQDQVHHADIPE
jgi:hypothetical protein